MQIKFTEMYLRIIMVMGIQAVIEDYIAIVICMQQVFTWTRLALRSELSDVISLNWSIRTSPKCMLCEEKISSLSN
jgi:hypothetical protein